MVLWILSYCFAYPADTLVIFAAVVIGRWNYNPPPERDWFHVSYLSVLLFTLQSNTTHFLLCLCIVNLVHYNIRILNLTLNTISCVRSLCDHHVLVPGAVDLVTTLSNSHGELSKMSDITILQSWCFCSCTEEQDERRRIKTYWELCFQTLHKWLRITSLTYIKNYNIMPL